MHGQKLVEYHWLWRSFGLDQRLHTTVHQACLHRHINIMHFIMIYPRNGIFVDACIWWTTALQHRTLHFFDALQTWHIYVVKLILMALFSSMRSALPFKIDCRFLRSTWSICGIVSSLDHKFFSMSRSPFVSMIAQHWSRSVFYFNGKTYVNAMAFFLKGKPTSCYNDFQCDKRKCPTDNPVDRWLL